MSQSESQPKMITIIKGKDRPEMTIVPEPKPAKVIPVTSWRARTMAAFEAKLEPWLLAGKPRNSNILYAIWWLYAIMKLDRVEWIPQPRMILFFNREASRVMARISDIRHVTMAIITVMTAKGGATKTTISTWLVAIFAIATGLSYAIYDTNRGGGKVAGRFDLEKSDVMSTRSLNKRVWQNNTPTYDELLRTSSSVENMGVFVFHHIAGNHISTTGMIKTANELKKQFHSVIIDTSPNLRDASTYGASSVSTVRVVVGKASSDEDMEDIEETLRDSNYQLREQIGSVVIAISDLPGYKCGTRTQYAYAERFNVHPDQIVLIPTDPYLKKVGKVRRSSFNGSALSAHARLALIQLAELVGTTVMHQDDIEALPSVRSTPQQWANS
jgi:cellulose biosynthesis protein BcsQ